MAKQPWTGLAFTISSGPSFLMTFAGVMTYAYMAKAPFSEVWIALTTLYGLHAGKRLWQRLKAPNLEMNGNGGNGGNGEPATPQTVSK